MSLNIHDIIQGEPVPPSPSKVLKTLTKRPHWRSTYPPPSPPFILYQCALIYQCTLIIVMRILYEH